MGDKFVLNPEPEFAPSLPEPKVRIELHARANGTWFWTVKCYGSKPVRLGQRWCPRIASKDIESSPPDLERQVAIVSGGLAEHLAMNFGSTFDPSECARLGVEALRDLMRDLERTRKSRHASGGGG